MLLTGVMMLALFLIAKSTAGIGWLAPTQGSEDPRLRAA
jgi:hypothetical protein